MSQQTEKDEQVSWERLLVDGRIARRLRELGLEHPLPQQKEAISGALRQKDVLLSSRTGSGKTLSFVVPVVQLALSKQGAEKKAEETLVVILEPTKELCKQVHELLCTLCAGLNIQVGLEVGAEEELTLQALKAKKQQCAIVVATPRCLEAVGLDRLELLVIDEVDLMCAFSFQEQLKELCSVIPAHCQKFLCSATLPQEAEALSGLLLREDAVSIKEDSTENIPTSTSFHYFAYSSDLEKYLLLFALFKLDILRGRALVFTPKLNEAHRVKFFLERFGIKPLLFAPSLPLEYRQAQIQRFNLGAADILIVSGEETREEAGVIRGIDFESVDVVLNFSFPQTVEDLLHIAGRAGRGTGATGQCVSFLIDIDEDTCRSGNLKKEFGLQNQLLQTLLEKHPDIKFQYQELNQTALQSEFGYRVRDVFTQMTDKNIQKYRLQQLQNLAFESAELRQHFRQHQKDALLMQRKTSVKAKGLTAIPDYLRGAADAIKEGCSLQSSFGTGPKNNPSYARRSALVRRLSKK